MKYTFILQSKQRYGAMRTFFSDFFPLPLYCSSLLANVWCSPPSIVHCKWTLALTIALEFALCSIFAHMHILKTFPHSSVSGGGVDDVCIRNCVCFSRAAIFSLFSCSFSIFCSAIFGRSTETDKREMSVSISINTAWKMNVSTLRTAKKNWCEYVRVWRRHACVCVDFSFTIVNKSTIWHRLSFNLVWRFWLFIFSSCVNSTPVQIYVGTDI